MVTKIQVFHGFIEEYEQQILEDYNKIRDFAKVGTLDKKTFKESLKALDDHLSDNEIEKLFKEACKKEKSKNVSREGFCISVLKNKIGGYGRGPFGNFYIDLSVLQDF